MSGSSKLFRWYHGLIFALIVLAVVFLDQWSKDWIRAILPPGGSLPEIGCLSIVHVQNTGAAFGLFTNQAVLLSIIAVAGMAVVILYFYYLANLGIAGVVALSLIFSGALGNQIDRFRFGHVTDFIYVRLWGDFYWPAFNVADSAITVGAITLAIVALTSLKRENDAKARVADKAG
jgi:signal peptidase II